MARTEQVTQGLVVKQKDQAPPFLPPNNSIKLDMLADEVAAGVIDTGTQTFSGDKTFSDNIVIDGNLTVNGTSTILNITTVEVEDPNVLLNRSGDDASAQGAGLTIDRTGVSGSLIYDSTLASRWKAGDVGSESEILVAASAQTITGAKTFTQNLTTQANLLIRDDSNSHYSTITQGNLASTRIYTIPDAGGDADFLMTAGTQTITGAKTFSGTTTFNNTALRLQEGGASPTHFATVASAALGNNYTFTIPNVGNSDFVMTAGNQTIGGNKTFSGNTVFNGEIETNAVHLGGYGLVPVGFIGAYNPGYYTNGANAGFATIGPAGNSVAQVNAFLNAKGWYVCDGSAVNVAASPIWNAAGRHLPNLVDSRFLLGSSAAGTQGGTDSVTLSASNIPSLSISGSTDSGTSGDAGNHNHTMNHGHSASSEANGDHTHSVSVNDFTGSTGQAGAHNHTAVAGSRALWRNGAGSASVGASGGISDNDANSEIPAAPNHTHTFNHGHTVSETTAGSHSHTITVNGFSGNTGSNGTHSHSVPSLTVSGSYTNTSPSAISILPKYLSTYFIIRVF